MGQPTKISLVMGPGIEFVAAEIENQFDLVNYQEQINAMTAISRRAIEEKAVGFFLCFGMGGTGKSSMVKSVKCTLNTQKIRCSILHIKCNTFVQKAASPSVAREYLDRSVSYMADHRPSMVMLDELDALASSRVGEGDPRVTAFAQLVCSVLDESFCGETPECPQTVVAGLTNNPAGIDEAVRTRLGLPVYIPLPGIDVIREIILKHDIPEHEKVTDRIIESLGTDRINLRGLVAGCKEAKREISKGGKKDPENIAQIILANCMGIISRLEVERYERINNTYIKQSKWVLDYWGQKK